MLCKENDIITVGNVIADPNDWLETLEADMIFLTLEHIVSSLRNGDEGLQSIHTRASNLQELWKFGP